MVLFIAWFAILFTGRYPRGMFGFQVGYYRWLYRVYVYLYLFTDAYPPFSMEPDSNQRALDGGSAAQGQLPPQSW